MSYVQTVNISVSMTPCVKAYLVKYPVKFSDAASEEWLNDAHGGDAIAKSFLFRYKPYEPEMVLQLFGARFRQWRCNSRTCMCIKTY